MDSSGHLRLRELQEKYDLLIALRMGQPGRTSARREAMRSVADRFPAALREWDMQPLAELLRRQAVVKQALLEADQGAEPEALRDPAQAWLRYALDLHHHLREVLQQRRLGLAPQQVGSRVTEVAYARVAALHRVEVAEIKHALFHPVDEVGPR